MVMSLSFQVKEPYRIENCKFLKNGKSFFAQIEKISFTSYERLSLCRGNRGYLGLRI